MLPVKELYAIYPSVILADKKSEMTIAPNERAFMFFENEEYTVTVASIDTDESNAACAFGEVYGELVK